MRRILLLSLLVIGIIYRLGFTHLFPQPFVFDQWDYDDMAKDMIAKKEYQTISPYHAFRTAGYPFILAAVYYIFGQENQLVWVSVQAILDTLVAIFIFIIAKKIFAQETPAWMAFLIYLFNPFTSAYVGVRLTEITAIFLLVLVFLLVLLFLTTRDLKTVFSLGFILGFLPQVRPSFTFFSLVFLFFLIYKIRNFFWSNKFMNFTALVLLLIFFIAPFSYNIWRNLTYFNRFSLLMVDNVFVKEFYISLFIEREYGSSIPPEVNLIHQEYSLPTKDKEEMANKYWGLSVEKIKQDPSKFLITRIKKMWYIWEKHQIFPYKNPKNSLLTPFIYWANLGFLIVALLGHLLLGERELLNRKKNRWFIVSTGFLFVYLSLIHAFTHASERFSLPAYPLVSLFFAYGFWKILGCRSKIAMKHD